MLCHINLYLLILLKELPSNAAKEKIEDFKAIIEGYGIKTTIRRKLGADINAAWTTAQGVTG